MIYSKNKEDLIIKYLPLVKKIVNRIDISSSDMEYEDLINIGVIGLIDAINKFDKDKNVPFEAYAQIRIRGNIVDELRRQGPISRNKMKKLTEFYNAKEQLEKELLRSPTEKEICEKLDIGPKELASIHRTVHYLSGVSLEDLIFPEDGNNTKLMDMIEDKKIKKPGDLYEEKEVKEALVKAIDNLNNREKTLLNLYYVEELTMKEIGYILDISVPRVSQIHGEILLKLRSELSEYMEDK